MTRTSINFTPREIVSELDRYIVGQNRAKRAMAIALRNRYRRQQIEGEMKDEITPKNVILIGPTGVGKTEIARRLAKLAHAPFIKVEASKFTEVGYVGRDVESMIRDLVEQAVQLVRKEEVDAVEERAKDLAERRIAEILVRKDSPPPPPPSNTQPMFQNPMLGALGFGAPQKEASIPKEKIDEMLARLRSQELEETEIDLDIEESAMPFVQVFGPQGQDEMNLKDLFSQLPGMKGKSKRTRRTVAEARPLLTAQEAQKLVDNDKIQRDAVQRAEQNGIIFLDEIDKIASRKGSMGGPDVSREGVQRDLLPVVEGSTVNTKYGPVKTDHILFVAAGAFHVARVSDLIPELQGRFPIRVELEPLTRDDLIRILKEPKNAMTRQYEALMKTEGVNLRFTDEALNEIGRYAEEANQKSENIGARRLAAVFESLLEELLFQASEIGPKDLLIDEAFVKERLEPVGDGASVKSYIL